MPQTPTGQSPDNTAYSGALAAMAPGDSRVAARVLAITLAGVPIAGVPGEWVLQDTLKSALLAIGVLVACIALLWSRLQPPADAAPALRWHGLLLFPAVLCGYALGSMAWSHTYLAGVEAGRWAVLGLLLWVALQTVRRDTLPLLLGGVHAGAVGASVWVAAQFWGDMDWFAQAAVPASTFVNRNFFAEYLVSTLPLSALFLLQLKAPHWRQLVALSLALNIVALMMTGTRSALLACLLVAPVLGYALWRTRHALAVAHWSAGSAGSVLAVLVAGVLCLGAIPTANRTLLAEGQAVTPLERSLMRAGSMAKKTEYTQGSFSARAGMWRSTARMLIAHPWSGVGAGAWEVHIPVFQGRNNSLEADFYAHNEFLQLMGEYGFPVGGGALAVLLAYLLLRAQRTRRMPVHGLPGQDAALYAVALCSLLALFIVSNAGFPWRLASTGAVFMLALALLAAETASTRPATPLQLKAGLVGLALALLAAIGASVQAMRAESHIVRSVQTLNLLLATPGLPATQQAALQDEAFALLQTGVAINPHYRKLTSLAADQFAATGNLRAALWAQDSVAASRPHIPDVHANRVLLHSGLQQPEAAASALAELVRLQPDAPRTRALGILLLRRAGRDGEAAKQLKAYLVQGFVEYDLVRFALAIGLERNDEALTIQAYRLWAGGWPAEAQAQAEAVRLAPPEWRARMP